MSRARVVDRLLVAAAVFAACLAFAPGAARTAWATGLRSTIASAATTTSVQSIAGVDLQATACPTVTTCVAVGITSAASLAVPGNSNVDGAVVVTITNGVPGPIEQLSEASELYGIACPTATLCEAVGTRSFGSYVGIAPPGLIATITPGAAPQVQSLTASNSGGLLSVTCPTSTLCLAVNTSQLVTIVDGVPSSEQQLGFPVTNVACANATTCEAVGSTTTYNNTSDPARQVGVVPITNGVAGTPVVVPGHMTISGLACPSVSTCQAVGSYYYGVTSPTIGPGPRGVVLPIVNGVPGDAQLTPSIKNLAGIACANATSCRAVGDQDRTISPPMALMAPITNGIPDGVEPVSGTSAPSAVELLSVACPSVTFCEAVGYTKIDNGLPIGLTVAITPGTPTPVGPTIANFTYPFNGQTAVRTDVSFEWSPVPAAQGYRFTAGTTPGGRDLSDSALLPGSQYSFNEPVMPPGPVLYGTIYTELDGVWRSQSITFTVAPSQASFSMPWKDGLASRLNVDPTGPFTWTSIPQAQGYILVVGTTNFGTNVANSGVLPASQLSYTPPILAPNTVLHATLLTKVNGAFTRYQALTFATGPLGATFTGYPNGPQPMVGEWFAWTTRAQAQNYILVIGTTPLRTNVYNSGLLGTATWAVAPAQPKGKTLYATLLTEIQGAWYYQTITYTS